MDLSNRLSFGPFGGSPMMFIPYGTMTEMLLYGPRGRGKERKFDYLPVLGV